MDLNMLEIYITGDHICVLDDNESIQLVDTEAEIGDETVDAIIVDSIFIEQKRSEDEFRVS